MTQRLLFWPRAARLPEIKRNQKLANTALITAGFCLLGVLWAIQRGVKEAASAEKSPVRFVGPWQPNRKTYQPGDMVRFTYVRDWSDRSFAVEQSLLVLSLDAFENIDTGEIYPGVMYGRVLDAPGKATQKSVRFLPERMTPGTYVLEGWASCQTVRRSSPTSYRSLPFEVVGVIRR